jgi:hypothetical protein
MTLPTDPTSGGGAAAPELRAASLSAPAPGDLAGIRELLSLLRELVDRLEDRIEHLAEGKG